MWVRIFPDGRVAITGTPLNEGRRIARQMHRQRDRKIRRKNAMLWCLIDNGLMPKDEKERRAVAILDPYELRSAALERKLKPHELGRILMQFSIRRGFKSSRKYQAEKDDAEQAGMLGGIKTLESELQGLTLGQWLYKKKEKRGYRAFVSAHCFRILQEINNLKYYNAENRVEEIPQFLKSKLFEELNSKKTLTFDRIRKLFGEGYDGSFNLEDGKRSGLKGNETSVDFHKPEFFGPVWDTLDIQTQDRIIETLMIEGDETALKNFLEQFKLGEAQIKNISGYNLPTGTVMLSSRFMIACSDIMLKEHLPYHEAVERLGLHHSQKEKPVIQRSLPYYGKILSASVSGAKGEQWDGPDVERYADSQPVRRTRKFSLLEKETGLCWIF
jgi:hypothetical protein